MSIFDDLLAMEEEEIQLTKAKDSEVKFISKVPTSEDSELKWLSSSASHLNKKVPVKSNAWETKLKKVQTSKLIWAKCNYFKGSAGAGYYPGRIANINEGACQKDIPTSIKSDRELIEFFCLPKKDPAIPQYLIVMKSEICPYDSVLNGRRQLSLVQSFNRNSGPRDEADSNDQTWDNGRMELMRQNLKAKYSHSLASTIFSKIKQKAKEFLMKATDYEGSGIFQDDASDDEDSQDSDEESSATPKINLEAKLGEDLFKSVCGRIGGEKLQKIAVGRWLSFQNKIYPDRTECYRVMEVTINPPTVKLENDSILRARDVVCLHDALPVGATSTSQLLNSNSKIRNVFVAGKGGYVAGSGYSRPLEDYELVKGKIKVAEVEDEEMLLETAKRDASLPYIRTPSVSGNKEHTQENVKRAGSSSSSSSSSGRVKSILETLNVDDDDHDDDIDSVIFIDHEKPKKAPVDDYSNGTLSDDSDQPIMELIAKRERKEIQKEKEKKARRAEDER